MIGLVDGNNFFVSCERVVDPRLKGRPVAVLSNNDGCCVSRSNEFKALGIPMGTPYFQLKAREATGELVFKSSNYELYGDMSRRIVEILRMDAAEVEQYSIDEAFIHPPTTEAKDSGLLYEYGKRLRSKILRWTGIPCGVGFAPTKTLAKIANHIGKKLPEGVFVMPADPADILAKLPLSEVWGIGRRLAERFRAEGVHTAAQFCAMRDEDIRALGSVTVLRTAMELRGTPCTEERDYGAAPDSISCSRSFGRPVTTLEELAESVAAFTAQAAVKLRRHGLLAAGANIYAQYGNACENGWTDRTVMFGRPTDATNEMLAAIREEVGALFLPGLAYRKSGMVFFGLEKPGSAHQLDLFVPEEGERTVSSKLYRAVDALNARFGRGKVFSAAEGIAAGWKMRRDLLSRRATTRWDELISVR